jgi:Ca2+-binding RTX toxin-like protein
MAKLKWYAGNNGVYGYSDFSDMPRIFVYATGANTYVSNRQFDETSYTYDNTADIYWFQGKFTKNSNLATDGFVTGYTAYNKDGDVVMSGSGLNVNLADVLYDDGFGNYLLKGDFWTTMMAGGNTFVGANNLGGVDWGDWIETGTGNDTIYGLAGGDWVKDAGGADYFNGGSGSDVMYYSNWNSGSGAGVTGITANLKTGQIAGPDGFTDTVKSVEGVVGTQLNDTFIGNRANNMFRGEGGVDTYSGGGGSDTLRFDKDAGRGGTAGITIDLKAGTATDGFGNAETFTSIENVRGTNAKDAFVDNKQDNYFRGFDGDDVFKLSGGNDTINAGAGADTFVFRGLNFGADVIEDFSQTDGDQIRIKGTSAFSDLTIVDDGAGNALVTFAAGTGSIELSGMLFSDLTAADFIF